MPRFAGKKVIFVGARLIPLLEFYGHARWVPEKNVRVRLNRDSFFVLYFFIIFSFFCLMICYADDEKKEENNIQEPVQESPVENEEGEEEELVDIKDPFRSAFPKKVETKIISMQQTTVDTGDEFVALEPDEFDYSSLTVTGLFWGSDKPKAIVNDEIVGIGSVVNGATIVQIDAKGILFDYNEKQFLLQRSSGGEI